MTPEVIVQKQLDAYNARDLDAFIACYAEDIQLFRNPEPTPVISGKAALTRFYAEHRFSRPALSARLVSRMVVGNKVIDHEWVAGLDDSSTEPVHTALVFQVNQGLIRTVWVFDAS